MFPGFARSFAFSVSLLLLGISPASADLAAILPGAGSLQHWSILTLGDETSRDELAGSAFVQGDVGVAGIGRITLRHAATIDGDLYCPTAGSVEMGPYATVTGSRFHDQDALLDSAAAAAVAISRQANQFSRTYFAPNDIELSQHRNFTVSGEPGATVVVKLGNFRLSGNSSFTLEGTATTTFIINVSKRFSLSDNAQVVLSGGVQWNNVLFNIRTRDSAVSLSGNVKLSGMLMANNRTVRLSGQAQVDGEVIANRILFSDAGFKGNARVGHPPLVSP
ncbi:MAG TPA: ice-binding family protein [Chthoniobacterales bacterium]|nr:ice-binding family protein [Chthoniobacterales bacterium]